MELENSYFKELMSKAVKFCDYASAHNKEHKDSGELYQLSIPEKNRLVEDFVKDPKIYDRKAEPNDKGFFPSVYIGDYYVGAVRGSVATKKEAEHVHEMVIKNFQNEVLNSDKETELINEDQDSGLIRDGDGASKYGDSKEPQFIVKPHEDDKIFKYVRSQYEPVDKSLSSYQNFIENYKTYRKENQVEKLNQTLQEGINNKINNVMSLQSREEFLKLNEYLEKNTIPVFKGLSAYNKPEDYIEPNKAPQKIAAILATGKGVIIAADVVKQPGVPDHKKESEFEVESVEGNVIKVISTKFKKHYEITDYRKIEEIYIIEHAEELVNESKTDINKQIQSVLNADRFTSEVDNEDVYDYAIVDSGIILAANKEVAEDLVATLNKAGFKTSVEGIQITIESSDVNENLDLVLPTTKTEWIYGGKQGVMNMECDHAFSATIYTDNVSEASVGVYNEDGQWYIFIEDPNGDKTRFEKIKSFEDGISLLKKLLQIENVEFIKGTKELNEANITNDISKYIGKLVKTNDSKQLIGILYDINEDGIATIGEVHSLSGGKIDKVRFKLGFNSTTIPVTNISPIFETI